MKLGFQKVERQLKKKDEQIERLERVIKEHVDEIARRKFLERQVQVYVKGLIEQNASCKRFLNEKGEEDCDKFLR